MSEIKEEYENSKDKFANLEVYIGKDVNDGSPIFKVKKCPKCGKEPLKNLGHFLATGCDCGYEIQNVEVK